MANWRPEGWETSPQDFRGEPYTGKAHKACSGQRCASCAGHVLYEAGADAMLDALRKTGEHHDTRLVIDEFGLPTEIAGTLVFIPDEEV